MFPSDREILRELMAMARRHPERGLLQFGGMVGAHQYLRLYRIVRDQVAPGARVLDWGTGNGHFSYFLQRAGMRAAGYSLLPGEFRSWLPDPASYDFRRGGEADPVGLPYEDGSFDAVASVGVLEHVRETGGDETASLGEIARVLRPDGVFVCYHFPNRWSVIDAAARRVPGLHHHDFRYTRRDIAALTRGAGLTLVASRRYGILPRNFSARLPDRLARSAALAAAWDAADAVLGAPLTLLCQNYLFIARKPSRGAGGGSTAPTAPPRPASMEESKPNEPASPVSAD